MILLVHDCTVVSLGTDIWQYNSWNLVDKILKGQIRQGHLLAIACIMLAVYLLPVHAMWEHDFPYPIRDPQVSAAYISQ